MSPKLNLYISPGTCSLACHILLQESGLNFLTTSIPPMSPTTSFPPSLLHLNPKGRVPILVIGETGEEEVITEVPAIMTAISQFSPEKGYLGRNSLQIVRSYEWMAWLSGTLHGQAFGGVLRPARFSDNPDHIDAIRAKARESVKAGFAFIEAKLEGREFAVGDAFTAVDAYLLVFWRWGNSLGFGMRENYPGYTRLIESVARRESVKRTVEKEGIAMFGDRE